MFTFLRSISEESLVNNSVMLESEERSLHAVTARSEHERVSTNWIEHKVPWSNLHNKIKLNIKPNETITYVYDNLWGINIKTLMVYLIEESG